MADVKFTPQFDDSQVQAALARLANNVDEVQAAADEMGDSVGTAMDKAATSASNLDKSLESATKNLDSNKVALKGADDSAKSFNRTIIGAAKNIKVFGVSINDVQQLLGKKRAQLKAVGTGLRSVNGLLKAFKVALAATGVGAIVLALGSLVSLLTRTQRGIDFVNTVVAQASATVDVFVDRLSGLGDAIVKLFQRDFAGAAEEAKAAFSGVVDEIREEVVAAGELERASQRLRDRQREFNEEAAKQQRIIEGLRNASRDETLTLAEREAKLREVIQIETDLEAKRLELAKENVRIIEQKNALGESLAEDLDAESQARIELDNISAESERSRREDLSQIQTLRRQAAEEARRQQEEERARVQALTDEYEKLIAAVEQRANNVSLNSLTGLDRIQEERRLAREEVERYREEVINAAAAISQDLPPDFEDNIQLLFDAIDKAYADGFRELRDKLFQESQDVFSDVNDPLEFLTSISPDDPAINQLGDLGREILENAEADMRPILERIQEKLLSAFGITEEEAQFAIGAASDIINNLTEIADSRLEAELSQIDAIISRRQEAVGELQRQLEEEKQLRDEGNANDVARVQARLDEETRLIAKEQARRLDLERKAANRQLVIDSLLTASQYALAAAKLASNSAGAGLPGLILALGGLAVLTTIIARAKANASELTAPEQLRKGKKLQGPSHVNGGIPLNVEGRWYEAEGGEYLIGSAPSREHDQFLANLNARKYDNVPLLEIAENARKSRFGSMVRNTKAESKKFRESRAESRYRRMERVIREEVGVLGDRVVGELQKHPQYYQKDGQTFRRWSNGNKDQIV